MSLSKMGITVHRQTKVDQQTSLLDFMISTRQALNMLDNPSWLAFTDSHRIQTWSPKTMTQFLLRRAIDMREAFAGEGVRHCPGISACVDEWSDRTWMPWMGITILTVDLNFTMEERSPGMQFISDTADAANLLAWFTQQIGRMGIQCDDVASVCTDNAANISKAMELDSSLKDVRTFCICHLINIAVKRAVMQPVDPRHGDQSDLDSLPVSEEEEEEEGDTEQQSGGSAGDPSVVAAPA